MSEGIRQQIADAIQQWVGDEDEEAEYLGAADAALHALGVSAEQWDNAATCELITNPQTNLAVAILTPADTVPNPDPLFPVYRLLRVEEKDA